jgi:hypothetical protein
MPFTAKLDEWGKPAWAVAIILGFLVFWPIGLITLFYVFWSGRMGCSERRGFGRWQEKMDRVRSTGRWNFGTSGNAAFDEYRNETLKRLEDEEREFHDFLRKLRQAKDKQEFDAFMADRRTRTAPATVVDAE